MLTKGNKSDAEERLNALMQRLSGLSLKPDFWKDADFSTILKELGVNLQEIKERSTLDLIERMIILEMNWEHLELFADCIGSIPEDEYVTVAKDIYQYIQDKSGVFSFQLMHKISQLHN